MQSAAAVIPAAALLVFKAFAGAYIAQTAGLFICSLACFYFVKYPLHLQEFDQIVIDQ